MSCLKYPFGFTSRVSAISWIVLMVAASSVGLFSLRYMLGSYTPLKLIPNFYTRRSWLILHATFSSLAILTGPWQFLPLMRREHHKVHQVMGYMYSGAVLIGWITSIPLALNASHGGHVSAVGFLTLGILWIFSTGFSVVLAIRHKVKYHREWMMRSYALTCSAITLRIGLGVIRIPPLVFSECYPVVSFLCWIINLVIVEWIIWRCRVLAARQRVEAKVKLEVEPVHQDESPLLTAVV